VVLTGAALREPERPDRRRLLAWAVALPVVLCSSVVWLWSKDSSGIDGFLGGNTYVWIALGLLFALPVRRRRAFWCAAHRSAAHR
jgi:alpha-1,2-mannosyltransferase